MSRRLGLLISARNIAAAGRGRKKALCASKRRDLNSWSQLGGHSSACFGSPRMYSPRRSPLKLERAEGGAHRPDGDVGRRVYITSRVEVALSLVLQNGFLLENILQALHLQVVQLPDLKPNRLQTGPYNSANDPCRLDAMPSGTGTSAGVVWWGMRLDVTSPRRKVRVMVLARSRYARKRGGR